MNLRPPAPKAGKGNITACTLKHCQAYSRVVIGFFEPPLSCKITQNGRKMVAKVADWSQNGRKADVRKSTKYAGVQARESTHRRFRGKPDVCFTIDYRDESGKRVRKDVGWASEGMSAGLANRIRLELISGKREAAMPLADGEDAPCPTLDESWQRYLEDWLKARGKRYESDTLMYNARLRGPLGHLRLDQITVYRLDRLMADLGKAGLSVQSVRYLVGMVRRIMRRMAAWRLYRGPLPFAEVQMPRPNNERQRFLSPEEAHRLLEALLPRSKQMWLMSLISLHCGLRWGEIAGLRRMDIDLAEGLIYIAESKSGKARHAHMTSTLREALAAMPPRPADALLFPARNGGRMLQPSDVFIRTVDALGLNDTGETRMVNGKAVPVKIADRRQRIVFHSLRHTYASWLAMSGEGQHMIADLLGHSSLEMSRRYTHLNPSARKATATGIETLFSLHGETPDENQ